MRGALRGRTATIPPMVEVRVSGGMVRGAMESGVAVFRGIPFAAPPVGDLRFAAPQPAAAWDGVRDALAFGPPPPQPGAFGMDQVGIAGDDWLTVNVWSPDPSANLPVMVWIQGGAYIFGTSGLAEYDGARLAQDGVVVVTFNYRVGIEGFALVEGTPANRGLLDQVAALEWVRDNIGAFGGDPGRVTIFGQSAGGGSVAALLAMPRAAGLFHRAVASSVPGPFFTPELASDITAACAAELGVRPAELSTVDPELLPAVVDELMAKIGQFAGRWGQTAHKQIPFAPVVDGDVLPVTPWEAVAAGAAKDIALVVGHTRHEQRVLTLIEGMLGQVTDQQAATALDIFAPGPDGARRYRESFPDAGPDELYDLVCSDWVFRMPSLRLAEAQVAAGGRAHVYVLAWEAPGMGGALGACHGLDVPLVFGNLDRGQPAVLIGEDTSAAAEVSDRMRRAWTGFALTGDPGWPVYSDDRLTRVFGDVDEVTAYPEERSRRIWEDHPFHALGIPAAG
ncbi:carboxylesterase family protein [Lentzea sp. NPDC051838]|uniref:carboxylesterase/lipase family protein n=1 Tax=Lentzea sp. NPDC051838 TaxID=3154849 RepID=UPI00341F36AF